MRAVFDPSDLTFRLHYDTNVERDQLLHSFNRKIDGWRFKTKNIPGWNGDVQFINQFSKLPAGLWGELKKVCTTYQFPLKVEGFNSFLRNDVSWPHVKEYCEKLIDTFNENSPDRKLAIRDYQPKAVYLSLKFRLGMNDLSTSAGKTLIMFMYAAYVHEFIDPTAQILSIEPDPDYVIQTYTEVSDFALRSKTNLKIGMVSGSSSLKDISMYDFIVGNFQTLVKREKPFFEKVRFCMVDEGHRAKSNSIKNIMKLCPAKDRIGLSGTVIDNKTAEHYEILAATGPTIIKVTKKDLMDAGYAPGIKIKIYVLSYATEEQRRHLAFQRAAGTMTEIDQYNYEMGIIRNSKVRMEWLAQMIANFPKNSLSFFIDKQNEFGKRLCEHVRQISQKELYYIDGDVKDTMRDLYKQRMEEGNDKGIVATYQTYATGKSIKNLHYFLMAEPMKSEVIVGQAIGRGMREYTDGSGTKKEEFHWIDVVDDFTWQGMMHEEPIHFENILYKQMKERIKLYRKDQFHYEVIKIKLNSKQMF